LKWLVASLAALLLISSVLTIPFRLHPGWQVKSKVHACSEVVNALNRASYRVLLGYGGGGELVTECRGGSGIYYCLVLPGCGKYIKVEGRP